MQVVEVQQWERWKEFVLDTANEFVAARKPEAPSASASHADVGASPAVREDTDAADRRKVRTTC